METNLKTAKHSSSTNEAMNGSEKTFHGKWPIRLARSTVMILGTILWLLATQSILATFFPAPIVPPGQAFYAPDKLLGWKLIPNKQKGRSQIVGKIALDQKINSLGFRDTEHTYDKGQDTFRIVILGDSFCDYPELPLKQLFHSILERKLNAELNQPVERINLGIGGFGTAQEYLALKYYGLKYHPDLVILALFLGNDFHDNSLEWQSRDIDVTHATRPFFVLKDGKLEQRPSNPAPTNVERKSETALQRTKDLANKYLPDVVYRIRNVSWMARFLGQLGLIEEEPEPDLSGNHLAPEFELYLQRYPPEVEKARDVTEALILKIAQELKASEIGFFVVVIPEEFEFRADQWNELLQHREMRTLEFDVRKPERMLSTFFETNQIDYLLLRPGFEKYSNETGKDLHFHRPGDGHWNGDGHALGAQLVYQKLIRLELVRGRRNENLAAGQLTHVSTH